MANKIPRAYADLELQLSTAISVGDTTFSLSSATDDDGNALPSGKYCFTVNNGSSNKEYLIGQLNGTDVTSVVSVSRQGVESSGAAQAHRVGDSAIVSDFATIQRVADILRGQETLDADNPLYYDGDPTLTSNAELATVKYVLDNVNGGTVNFDNQVVTGVNAGETVADGDLVYFKTSDQEWYKTDADTAATFDDVYIGIARGAGTDGASISSGVLLSGIYTTTGLTAGDKYYVSDTAGEFTNTLKGRPVGIALSTTKLLLVPKPPQSTTDGVPVGTLFPYAGSSAPTHYLLCYGQTVSRTLYAKLFDVLGTTYGVGDGSTTFNLPDTRGRVIAGLDNLGGASADTVTDSNADSLGGEFGTQTHTLTIAEMPAHTHGTDIQQSGLVFDGTGSGGANAQNADTASTGGDGAHNNVQPTTFMSYIIKAL